MPTVNYETHLDELRRLYIEATPRQRLGIAKDRIENPGHDPNRLVAHVSAIEGFARSLAMHLHAESKEDLTVLYPNYRFRKTEDLISEYLKAKNLPEATDYFGVDCWAKFKAAVEYRNLLAHECTYLGQNISPPLIEACNEVMGKLAEANGLSYP